MEEDAAGEFELLVAVVVKPLVAAVVVFILTMLAIAV